MSIANLLKALLSTEKKIKKTELPSQGLFYKDDFEIKIKKAKQEDIIEYKENYIKDDLGSIINEIKKIVKKNVIISEGYSFLDIKSIDVVFLFLEIVSLTKGNVLTFNIHDDNLGYINIELKPENFNYFFINHKLMKKYNKVEKCFEIDGFKYTLPSIGIENSLTDFLISKVNEPDAKKYNYYFYDFTNFVGNKNLLTHQEVENLINVFNFDIDDSDMSIIKKILKTFEPIQRYSFIRDGYIIEITSKIDLEKIWL